MKKTKKPIAAAPAMSEPEALKCARSYCDEPRWMGLLCRRHYAWIMGEAPATVTMLEVSEIEPRAVDVAPSPELLAAAGAALKRQETREMDPDVWARTMAAAICGSDTALDQLARAIEKRIAAAAKKDA